MTDEYPSPLETEVELDDELDAEELYRLQVQEEEEAEPRDRVHLLSLVLIIGAGVLILLLSGCPVPGGETAGVGQKNIVPVPGKPAAEGSVSVWIDQGHTLTSVLRAAGVQSQGTDLLGNGRYVIQVTPGTEASSVEALRSTGGVIDAGLVYDGGKLERADVE